MPMYDYFCSTCNLTIGLARSVENRRKPADCPKCEREMKFDPFPQDTAKPEGRPNVKDVFRKF